MKAPKSAKFPAYKQTDRFDCGPACLKMISKYFGKSLSIEYLRYVCHISPDGITAKNLIDAFDEIGFHTMPASVNFETLSQEAPLPCVCYWRNRHFVIVFKVTKKKVYVADPAFGIIKYSKEEFLKGWLNSAKPDGNEEGLCILIEPSAKFNDQEDNEVSVGLRSILPYLKNFSNYFFQIGLGLIVGVLIQLSLPLVTQSLVDNGINYQDIHFVYILLFAQLMLFLSATCISILRSWILLYIGTRVSMLITSDYLAKLLKKTLSFFDSKTPGDILQRLNESRRIESFLAAAPEIIFSYFNALVFLLILAYYSLTILSIFIVGIILYTAWVWVFMKKRKALDFKRFDASSNINTTLIQTVHGIQEVQVNGSLKRHVWAWEKGRVNYYKNEIANLRLSQWQSIGGTVINELKNILITFTAALLVIDGQITLGAMLAIQFIIGQVNGPLLSVVDFFGLVQDAKLSLQRFKEIDFKTPEEELLNNQDLLKPELKTSDISLKNVSFSYDGENGTPVLKNIDLLIPKGKVTAIVGNSGSGKTTLMKLLLKLYVPTEGEIYIGNSDLNSIHSLSWRNLCGTVLQEGYIFSDTITNNITESAPHEDLDTSGLLEAVRIANIESLINDLPAGFNSMIGPSGSSGRTLSGGQRQRLLIARAVYKDPFFLFFDEATSALDANNEKAIVENLKSFNKGKTVVVIAHRLSTVKDADQIVVLDQGEIKEIGDHASLVQRKGHYFKLVKNQLELGN